MWSQNSKSDSLLGQGKIDRVTQYRVLEWLVLHGLAHRVTGEDRVRRFLAGENHTADYRQRILNLNGATRRLSE